MTNNRIFQYLSLLFFILLTGTGVLRAQNNVTEQVEVKRQFKPVLGNSVKIRKSPYFPDEPAKVAQLALGFKDISLKSDTAANSISADSLQRRDSTKFPPIYLELGAGNHSTVLGGLYLSSRPSPKGSFSANYRHLSLSGPLQNQKYSTDQVNLDGRKNFNDNFLSAHLGLDIKSNPFYGYDNIIFSFSPSQAQQVFKNFQARMELGKLADTAEGIHYFAKLGGYYLGDSYNEKENHLDFLGGIGYSKGNLGLNLKVDYQNNTLNTNPQNFNTSVGRLEPSVTLFSDKLKIELGLKIAYELGDRNSVYIFPDLYLDLQLAEGFTAYGGLKGDILQNTFKGLTQINPYLLGVNGNALNQNFLLQNTKQTILVYGGIKGAINPELDYKAQIDISQMDRLAFFVNTYHTPDNFTLVYDGNKTIFTKLYGEINYLSSDQLRFNSNLTINSYKLSSLAKPWYTPSFKWENQVHFNPVKNWYFNSSLFVVGTQYAQQASTGFPESNIYNSTIVNNEIQIKPYIDFNLGIEYRVSKKIGVFVQGNNLLNKQYLQFFNYPVIGLNVLAGLSIRF